MIISKDTAVRLKYKLCIFACCSWFSVEVQRSCCTSALAKVCSQTTGPAAKLSSLESFWLLLLRAINLAPGIYGCFRSTERRCEPVCMCAHAQQDSWPRAVPGSNASAFFVFLEKGRFSNLAFGPLFLSDSFLASRLFQISRCVPRCVTVLWMFCLFLSFSCRCVDETEMLQDVLHVCVGQMWQ